MNAENRASLRWVELVVLLVVIAMLLAMLLSYLIRSRGHPPPCLNYQKQLGFAMLEYESRRERFPGYRNHINDDVAGNPVVGSWLVMILADLEQLQLWEVWKDPEVLASEKPAIFWELPICPLDAPRRNTGDHGPLLSYVVNCGKPGDSDAPADGIFHNHHVDEPVIVSLDYISQHDGSTYTLLLSENVQAGLWTDTDEANVGVVWRDSPGPCNRINECRDAGDRPQGLMYARPSSNHPEGVNAYFCDGHGCFLSERVDYQVYQHLMTPNSSEAGVPGEFDPGEL